MADVERRSDGYRIVRLLSAVHDSDEVRHALAVGDIGFRDMTARQRDRERIQQGLDLVADQNSYLAMWDRYQELEARHIRGRLRDFGVIRYSEVKVESDGRCAFTVDMRLAQPRTRAALENTASAERMEIEAAADVPASATDTAMTDREWLITSRAQRGRAWVGEPLGYDGVTDTLRLAGTLNYQEDPPPSGWLYLAHRGTSADSTGARRPCRSFATTGRTYPRCPPCSKGAVGRSRSSAASPSSPALHSTALLRMDRLRLSGRRY